MLVKDLIDKYFHEGFRYKEIIASLKNNHGIKFGLRKLHRSLRRANFYWERTQSPLLDTVTFIQHEFTIQKVVVLVVVIEQYTSIDGILSNCCTNHETSRSYKFQHEKERNIKAPVILQLGSKLCWTSRWM